MTDPIHALAEKIAFMVVDGDVRDPVPKVAELLREAIGQAKQEWNRLCNEACEKQVNKQVLEARAAAFKEAAATFDDSIGMLQMLVNEVGSITTKRDLEMVTCWRDRLRRMAEDKS